LKSWKEGVKTFGSTGPQNALVPYAPTHCVWQGLV
jgi:hypothetical protein